MKSRAAFAALVLAGTCMWPLVPVLVIAHERVGHACLVAFVGALALVRARDAWSFGGGSAGAIAATLWACALARHDTRARYVVLVAYAVPADYARRVYTRRGGQTFARMLALAWYNTISHPCMRALALVRSRKTVARDELALYDALARGPRLAEALDARAVCLALFYARPSMLLAYVCPPLAFVPGERAGTNDEEWLAAALVLPGSMSVIADFDARARRAVAVFAGGAFRIVLHVDTSGRARVEHLKHDAELWAREPRALVPDDDDPALPLATRAARAYYLAFHSEHLAKHYFSDTLVGAACRELLPCDRLRVLIEALANDALNTVAAAVYGEFAAARVRKKTFFEEQRDYAFAHSRAQLAVCLRAPLSDDLAHVAVAHRYACAFTRFADLCAPWIAPGDIGSEAPPRWRAFLARVCARFPHRVADDHETDPREVVVEYLLNCAMHGFAHNALDGCVPDGYHDSLSFSAASAFDGVALLRGTEEFPAHALDALDVELREIVRFCDAQPVRAFGDPRRVTFVVDK